MALLLFNHRLHELPECDCFPRTADDDHLADCPFGIAMYQVVGEVEFVQLSLGQGHKRELRRQAA